MLDLKAGIHFKEEELSLLVDELDGSRVVVADSLRCLHCGLTHRFLNTIGQARSWSLFDEFLVATLRGAVTSGDPHHVALCVAHQLNLYVARPGEVTLDVDLVTTEEGFCFTLRTRHCIVDLIGRFDNLHAATATAVGSLSADRPPELVTERTNLIGALSELSCAWNDRSTTTLGRDTRRHLVTHLIDRFRRRSDPCHTHSGDRPSEVSILREEAIAGVNCVCATFGNSGKDRLSVEVTFCCCLTAESVSLVGETHMKCISVEFGVHRYRLDIHLSGSTNNTNSNFASVGDEDLFEHE